MYISLDALDQGLFLFESPNRHLVDIYISAGWTNHHDFIGWKQQNLLS